MPLGWSAPSALVSAVVRSVPSAPSISSAAAGNRNVTIRWNAPSNTGGLPITGYLVKFSTSPSSGFSNLLGASASARSATTVTGMLTVGKRYYFRVYARNAAGWSASSGVLSALVRSVPAAPSIISATPGNRNVTIRWNAPANSGASPITGYLVQLSTSPTTGFTNVGSVLSASARSVTTGTLTGGKRYYFRVFARNAVGWGVPSAVLNAVVRSVPAAPSITSATPGNRSVTVRWNAPTNTGGLPINGYLVQLSTSPTGVFSNVGGVLSANARSVTTRNAHGRDTLLLPSARPQHRRLERTERRLERRADRCARCLSDGRHDGGAGRLDTGENDQW